MCLDVPDNRYATEKTHHQNKSSAEKRRKPNAAELYKSLTQTKKGPKKHLFSKWRLSTKGASVCDTPYAAQEAAHREGLARPQQEQGTRVDKEPQGQPPSPQSTSHEEKKKTQDKPTNPNPIDTKGCQRLFAMTVASTLGATALANSS